MGAAGYARSVGRVRERLSVAYPFCLVMLPEITDPIQILAPLVALAVAYVLFYEGLLYSIGSDRGVWKLVRRLLPYVDDEAREVGFYTEYTVTDDEYVGTLKMSKDEARELFLSKGAMKAPLAAHKEDWDGRREFASLALYDEYESFDIEAWGKLKRFLMMAFVVERQLHITLFWDDELESVIITAHWEWSPYNVFKAYKHLRGKNYDVETGVRKTDSLLTDVKRFEPRDGASS